MNDIIELGLDCIGLGWVFDKPKSRTVYYKKELIEVNKLVSNFVDKIWLLAEVLNTYSKDEKVLVRNFEGKWIEAIVVEELKHVPNKRNKRCIVKINDGSTYFVHPIDMRKINNHREAISPRTME